MPNKDCERTRKGPYTETINPIDFRVLSETVRETIARLGRPGKRSLAVLPPTGKHEGSKGTNILFPDFVIAYPKKYKSYNFSRQECKKQGFSRIGGRACYFTRLFARLPKQQKQPLIIKHLQTYFEKVTKSGGKHEGSKGTNILFRLLHNKTRFPPLFSYIILAWYESIPPLHIAALRPPLRLAGPGATTAILQSDS